jgi:hypothetical protein
MIQSLYIFRKRYRPWKKSELALDSRDRHLTRRVTRIIPYYPDVYPGTRRSGVYLTLRLLNY